MNNTALIVGAGFSKPAGLPTTSEIGKLFLNLPATSATPGVVQRAISEELDKFWRRIFGFRGNRKPPSFEDHFTLLDLAANAGHNLGAFYTPARLRAIRRLSIHRVFDILDIRFSENSDIEALVTKLANGAGNAVISTNWDVVVENHLSNAAINYGIPIEEFTGNHTPLSRLPVLKLHGSANWAYCDCCRNLFKIRSHKGKGALHSGVFLETHDFEVLIGKGSDLEEISNTLEATHSPMCPKCNVRVTARVATFSFAKALEYFQFQAVWEKSLRALQQAERWIFIGYSLPEADFQLRHMLKTAQLSAEAPAREIIVVVSNESEVSDRYKQFFGNAIDKPWTKGFESWAKEILPNLG